MNQIPIPQSASAEHPKEDEMRDDKTRQKAPDVAYRLIAIVNVIFFGSPDAGIFPLEVSHQQNDWPEKQERSRMWVAPRKAAKLVKKSGLRRAIEDLGISSNFRGPLSSNRSVRTPRRP